MLSAAENVPVGASGSCLNCVDQPVVVVVVVIGVRFAHLVHRFKEPFVTPNQLAHQSRGAFA